MERRVSSDATFVSGHSGPALHIWSFRPRPSPGQAAAGIQVDPHRRDNEIGPRPAPGRRLWISLPALRTRLALRLPQRLRDRAFEIRPPPLLPHRFRGIGAELSPRAPEVAIEERVPEADPGVVDAERVQL